VVNRGVNFVVHRGPLSVVLCIKIRHCAVC